MSKGTSNSSCDFVKNKYYHLFIRILKKNNAISYELINKIKRRMSKDEYHMPHAIFSEILCYHVKETYDDFVEMIAKTYFIDVINAFNIDIDNDNTKKQLFEHFQRYLSQARIFYFCKAFLYQDDFIVIENKICQYCYDN